MASLNRLKNGQWCLMFRTLDKKQRKITAPKVLTETEVKGYKLLIEELLEYQKLDMEPSPKFINRLENLPPFWKQAFQRTELLETTISTAGQLWEVYLSKPRGRKSGTIQTYEQARDHFFGFFPEDTEINSITVEDGENYREHLQGLGLSEAYIALLIRRTRAVFNWAVDSDLLLKNVFKKVRTGTMENQSRQYFITREMYEKLLLACPNQDWRAFLTMLRIGAMRFSEALSLKWSDIKFADGYVLVHSTKTEHHKGKAFRQVPLFAEMRKELEELRDRQKGKKPEKVFSNLLGDYHPEKLRRQMKRIVRRAGFSIWPRLFHNLRGSRSNEMFRLYPPVDASQYIGQSLRTAEQHYLNQKACDLFDQLRVQKEGTSDKKADELESVTNR